MPQKIFVCLGLQRSGNHAVIDWIRGLFPASRFHNDMPHDLFADPDRVRDLLAEGPEAVTIFTFEDSANRMPQAGLPLLQSVVPFPVGAVPGAELHRLIILRDPYNTWASRVAANARDAEFGRKLTSDPSWDPFRENWLALAALTQDADWTPVLFNRWKDDEAYRRGLCAEFGGRYSDASLDAVPTMGGGSSFDGLPRPGYGQMVLRWRKYLSGPFLRRLVSRPGHYVKRFVTPPPTGRSLQVDTRWKTLLERPDSAALFADRPLRDATSAIFGAAILPPAPADRTAALQEPGNEAPGPTMKPAPDA